MKRVAIYIHHATGGEWRTWQPKMMQDHVSRQGNMVADTFVEIGYEGRNRRRPMLERVLQECEGGSFDEVTIARISHLSRNTMEAVKIYERLKKCGVSLSVMEFGSSSRVDEFMKIYKAVGYGA